MLYRGRVTNGPRPQQIYDIPFTSVSSFVLLMSSLTMVLAVSAAKRRDDSRTNLWLTVTALLGTTFVGGQIYEFTAFIPRGPRLHDEPLRLQLLHAHRFPLVCT